MKEKIMTYELAKKEELTEIYNLVQDTIKEIYPKYYPKEVVEFFCNLHNESAVERDMEQGYVSVLKVAGEIVGTGCFVDNHITRVYVSPKHHSKGYGTFIVNHIEEEICRKYDKACLDASLPASTLYEKLGYHTVKHEKHPVENGAILTYEIMEKELHKTFVGDNMKIKEIKELKGANMKTALSLVWNVFLEYEAPEYSESGIEEFYKSIHDEAYLGQLSIYGAYLDDILVGVIATRSEGSHIALFFVDGKYHRQGIGRMLFEKAKSNCNCAKMTVNSSPYAVAIYEKFGFCRTDIEQEVNGIRFTPMELHLL